MADEFDPKHGSLVAVPLYKANLTTGEANADLQMGGATTLVVAPKAGSVVGISIRASAALTAGSITARTHKASTEFADSGYPVAVINATNQASYAVVRPRALRFAAGDTLGISVTTTTTLDATDTLDVDGHLWLMMDDD